MNVADFEKEYLALENKVKELEIIKSEFDDFKNSVDLRIRRNNVNTKKVIE